MADTKDTNVEAPMSKRGKTTSTPPAAEKADKKEGNKTGPRLKHGAKADFIRRHLDKKPAEVSTLAKKAGLDLDPAYISTQQSKERNKSKKKGRKRTGTTASSDAEAEFTKLLKRIGSDRARKLIEDYEAE